MNATFATAAFTLALAVSTLAPVRAAAPVELNVRTDVGNASRNRVAAARLQAMLTDNGQRGTGQGIGQGIGGTSDDDCTTQIGNDGSTDSVLDRNAPIIIIGDVNNFCF